MITETLFGILVFSILITIYLASKYQNVSFAVFSAMLTLMCSYYLFTGIQTVLTASNGVFTSNPLGIIFILFAVYLFFDVMIFNKESKKEKESY